MKQLIIFISLFFSVFALGQSRDDFFIESANLYLNNRNTEALELVKEGLYQYPNDKKLEALKKKLEEQKEKQDQEQKQEQNENKNQQNEESQENKQSGEDGNSKTQERESNGDLQKEMYGNILKSLEKEEKKAKRRLIRQLGKKGGFQKSEKDW